MGRALKAAEQRSGGVVCYWSLLVATRDGFVRKSGGDDPIDVIRLTGNGGSGDGEYEMLVARCSLLWEKAGG